MFVATLLCLLAVPAAASAMKFESAPGTPLLPGPSESDPSPTMPPGFAPVDIAAGDFNKDGFDDVAVITDYIYEGSVDGPTVSHLSGNIYLYLGSEDGSLEPSASNPIGSNSGTAGRFMLRAIDVDGDGDLDLVAQSSPKKIEIYKNNLSGSNEAFGTVPSETLNLDSVEPAAGYRSVSLGDKDGDGDVDMVIGLYNNSYVLIRNRSDSSGLEIANGSVEVPHDGSQTMDGITSTALGRFSNSTHEDLVMISNPGFIPDSQKPDRLLFAKSNGDSDFDVPTELARAGAGEYLTWVKTVNLNGDQYDDLVFKQQTSTGDDIVKTALGSASGPVIQTGDDTKIPVYGAQPPALGDFNADGNQDVAIPQFVDAGFEMALGDGTGKLALDTAGPFALPAIGDTDFYPQATAALDVNGDDRLDFAAVSGHSGSPNQGRGVAIMLNEPIPGISVSPKSIDFGEVPFDAELVAPVPVTIQSNGDLPLNLGDISLSGAATDGFQLDRGDCPTGNLATGSSCTLEVAMKQSQPGYFNGYLDITNDATAEPIHIEVIGQVEEPDPTARFLSLKVKSAKKVKAGKQLVVTALIRNSGDYRSAKFDLRASAPKKLTGKIKYTPLRNLSIGDRSSSAIKFKVPVKRNAKGKLQVKISLVSSNRTITRKTGKVIVVRKKRR